MQYAFLLRPHSNARYTASLEKLALLELQCMMEALSLPLHTAAMREIGGVPFMVMETGAELTSEQWQVFAQHSGICFAASVEGELLRPLPIIRSVYLPDDLSQVMKYKGKTNAEFTRMMLNCTLCASGSWMATQPLTVLDPVAGRGTTLFCALERGMNAVGVEVDAKAVTETEQYLTRYLEYHRIKHRKGSTSQTLRGGKSLRCISVEMADTAEHYKAGDTRTLRLYAAEASQVNELLRKDSCRLIIGDLPYGVQHAPRQGGAMASLKAMVQGMLPALKHTLASGGSIALSFNVNTLPRQTVVQAMREAGLKVKDEPPYNDFSHWVEQAVTRDFVVGVKDQTI